MSLKKIKASRKYEDTFCIPLMDELVSMLEQTASPSLTHRECRMILRDLLIFANENPIALADNLFKEDQVTNVNSYHPKLTAKMYRNWQWVLHLSSGESLQEIAWRKSMSVQLGRFMSMNLQQKEGLQQEQCGSPQIVIGFWLKKIYEAIAPNTMYFEIPASLRIAYFGFLNWKGMDWRNRKISLYTLNVHFTWLKTKGGELKGDQLSKKQEILTRFWNEVNEDLETTHFPQVEAKEFCRGIGSKRLELYLRRAFKGTLEEFRGTWETQLDVEMGAIQEIPDPEEEKEIEGPEMKRMKMGTQGDTPPENLTDQDLGVSYAVHYKKRVLKYLS